MKTNKGLSLLTNLKNLGLANNSSITDKCLSLLTNLVKKDFDYCDINYWIEDGKPIELVDFVEIVGNEDF